MGHTAYEIMHILQEVGVAAAPVLSNKGLAEDPHLNAREWVVEMDHPEIGWMKYSGMLWKMSKTQREGHSHAPLMGEHNEYVLGELLGIPEDEIARLIENEVIY
jgi:crotonobetainyl-CoA:carnitine CoA-transferase CaiB-like acyl-CoA transferase